MPPKERVTPPLRLGIAEPHAGKLRQQFFKGDLRFQARERGTDAKVDPVAERHLADLLPTDVEAIRRVVESGLGLAPEPFLEKGRRVRINAGSLEGLEGMIQDVRHKHRLILSVTLLQRSIAVDIDRAWVTVLPKSGREKACSPPLWASASYCRS